MSVIPILVLINAKLTKLSLDERCALALQQLNQIHLLILHGTIWYLIKFSILCLLEMIHFTGDIFEKLVPQHLLPFYLSKIFHFSRQKLVLRQLFSDWRSQVIFFCKWVGYQSSLFDSSTKCYQQKVYNFPLGGKIKIFC